MNTDGTDAAKGHDASSRLNEGTVGGQTVLTHEVANYPGIESISGFQLANVMKNQAKTE